MADLLTSKEVKQLPDQFQMGVELHRSIDHFTDEHSIFRKHVTVLRKRHRKYAPVVLDILYDHLLANNWNLYSSVRLEDFSQSVYNLLERNNRYYPEKAAMIIKNMIRDDFLVQYRSEEGLLRAFGFMDRRTKFPSNFIGAIEDLNEHHDTFNQDFNVFFPELIAHAIEYCEC